jgi:hypothetical protein
MKSAPFEQDNVAESTKLTLKVLFCLEISMFFKTKLVKNVQFRYSMTGKFFFPHLTVANIYFENFFKVPFSLYPKVTLEAGAPPDLLMLPTPLIKRFLCNFLIVSHTSSNMYV